MTSKLVGVALAALLLAGCGASPAANPAPSSPAGGASSPPAAAASNGSAKPANSASAPAASSSAAAKASGTLKKVRYGDISRTAVSWPEYIAVQKGFFREEGLELDVTYVGSVAASVQQVVGGSLDMANTTFETAVHGIEGGAPIAIVGAAMVKYPYSVMAVSGVKTAADLKGKKAIMALPKVSSDVFFQGWLKDNGVNPSNVDTVYDGSTVNRFSALKSGSVQAALLTQPFDFRAADEGYRTLVDLGAYAKNYGFLSVVAQKQYLKDQPEVARSFLKAYSRAIDWLYDPKNKDEAISILDNAIKQEHDLDVKTWDYYVGKLKPYSHNMDVPQPVMQGVLDTVVAEGQLKSPTPPPSKYLDLSYLPK